MRGLLDTSVFIAAESGRELREDLLPEEAAVSVVTIAELHVGVLAAADVGTRALRLDTLDAIADVEALPVDEDVAAMWARMRVHLADTGRRVNLNDLWIAATAAAHGVPVVTQDDDFAAVEGVAGLAVVRV